MILATWATSIPGDTHRVWGGMLQQPSFTALNSPSSNGEPKSKQQTLVLSCNDKLKNGSGSIAFSLQGTAVCNTTAKNTITQAFTKQIN